jgi:hypothetical protein
MAYTIVMEFITFWDIWDLLFKSSKSDISKKVEVDYTKISIVDRHSADFIIAQYKYSNETITKSKYYEAKVKLKLYNYKYSYLNACITLPSDTVGKICDYFLKNNCGDYENIFNFLNEEIGTYFLKELSENIYAEAVGNSSNTCQTGSKTFVIDIDKIIENSLVDANKSIRFDSMKKHEAKSVIKKFMNQDAFSTVCIDEFVYCIGDDSDKFNKIGKSNNPNERLKQLQTGNPSQLYLKYTAKVQNSKFVEEELHKMFIAKNVIVNGNKEWFEIPSWKIISEIRKYEETTLGYG